MFGAVHFCRTWGGGGGVFGGGKYYSFEVTVYRKLRSGRVWVSPSHGGDVFGFSGTKTRFLVGYKV